MRTRSSISASSSADAEASSPNDTRRVVIVQAPKKDALFSDTKGQFLQLRHPKSGKSTCYILMNGLLQELHWFKQQYNSWFLGDHVCEDGSLYMATPIDPIFLVLPLLDEARMKKGDEPGKFRPLDEILFLEGYPAYAHLLPVMHDLLLLVCEVKEAGSMKFYRLDDQKLLAWLCCKVKQTIKILPTLNRHYAGQSDSDKILDAIGLLGEYVKEDPWLCNLCNHLGVDLEAAKRPRMKDPVTSDLAFETPSAQDLSKGDSGKSKMTQKNSASRGRPPKRNDEKGLQKITSIFKKC